MIMLAAVLATSLGSSFTVESGSGLTIRMAGVPIVKGSWWQYYEPGWTKGYYTSQNSSQQIETLPDGTVRLKFQNPEGTAKGTQLYQPRPDGLHVVYDFQWSGDHPVLVELTGGMLWAPAFQSGNLTLDGKPQRSLVSRTYPESNEIGPRAYGAEGSSFDFESPLGKIAVKASEPNWTLFDARNGYPQGWAASDDLLWFGSGAIKVNPGKTTHIELDWSFAPVPEKAKRSLVLSPKTIPLPIALEPAPALPVVPKPKVVKLNGNGNGCAISPSVRLQLPIANDALGTRFRQFIGSLWRAQKGGEGIVIGRVAKIGMPAEGYQIRVTNQRAEVVGQDPAGLQNGLYTLALLAKPTNGHLVVPVGTVRDWPSLTWRGVHMFVAPHARSFHQKLWEKLLLPLKLNKTVLQCERTDWAATPGIQTAITTPKDELRKDFEMMRGYGVEPIPLIQSFGHMEWIFENKKNLDLAINPNIPYTVDPDKPRTRQVLTDIWKEAFTLLHPKTVHFGLDEVGMTGFPEDPERLTRLWASWIPELGALASKNGAKSMLWSDEALAPGEATDATSAPTKEHAKRRRDAVPKGSIIGDWHYVEVPQIDQFETSLNIWKSAGMERVATTWYIPNNIRGFAVAAKRNGAGLLQTTWSGYESTEKSMLHDFMQLSAYVLSADYAWSGREEMPDKLGYNPDDFVRRMYLFGPQNTVPLSGQGIAGKPGTFSIAGVRFAKMLPLSLRSILLSSIADAPTEVQLATVPKGRTLAFAVDCAVRCTPGEVVASVEVTCVGGKVVRRDLRYGEDLRTPTDLGSVLSGPRSNGLSLVRLTLPSSAVGLRITSATPYAGFRVHGITAW